MEKEKALKRNMELAKKIHSKEASKEEIIEYFQNIDKILQR